MRSSHPGASSGTAMHPRAQWLCGVACICFVAVIWTLATVVKQVVFNNLKFNEPLVLAYVCNACYFVHVPLYGLGRAVGLVERTPWRLPPGAQQGDAPSLFDAVRAGLIIAPLWFAAQWTYSKGVAATSVTSSTVISTTSVVWTLLASIVFLGEQLNAMKVLGILACMGGNIVTLLGSDTEAGQQEHLGGDLLCLVAAMLYAAYTMVLTACTHPQSSVVVIFGTIGSSIMLAGAPLVFALRWEAITHMSTMIFCLLIFNGIFDNVLSQYAWAKAVQWTSPTTATVGLSLTIPLSIVADYARHVRLTRWSFVAAGLVLLGFVLATLASKRDAAEKEARPQGVNVDSDRMLGVSLISVAPESTLGEEACSGSNESGGQLT